MRSQTISIRFYLQIMKKILITTNRILSNRMTKGSNILFKWQSLFSLILIASTAFFTQDIQGQTLSAGFSQVDITPPQAHYPHYRGTSTGINDNLYAKAVVFKQGKVASALMVCDLLWVSRSLSSDVRQKAAAATGIPFENIVISATHSHTSPAYDENIRILNHSLRKDSAYNVESDPYPAWLAEQMVQSIINAHKQLVPVQIKSGVAAVNGISFNRRFLMKNGQVRTNPGVGNKDAIKATGPNDPDLGILLFERLSDRKTIGAFSNFAVHADTYGGTKFSADYPGVLAKHLAEKFGEQFVSVFGAGPCGNQNHVDVFNPSNKNSTAKIGKTLGDKLIAHTPLLKPTGTVLNALSQHVYVPLQHFTPEEQQYAHQPDAQLYPDLPFLGIRRRVKIKSLEQMRQHEAIPPAIGTEKWMLPLEVQIITLGKDVAIVGIPGELFVELGLQVKKNSPYKITMVVELTNVHIAYVPTIEGFKQGGYEAVNSRLHPGGGEALAETAIALLKKSYTSK